MGVQRGVYADAFLVVHIRKMYSSPIVTQYHSTLKMNDMYEKKKKRNLSFSIQLVALLRIIIFHALSFF